MMLIKNDTQNQDTGMYEKKPASAGIPWINLFFTQFASNLLNTNSPDFFNPEFCEPGNSINL